MSINEKMTALADSIRYKAKVKGLLSLDDMKNAVDNIYTGTGEINYKWDAVNFIDYDGTVLHSYSLEEIQTLTELPELPEHKGLICQGWNWTLDDIKNLGRELIVGAMYITDDGATRLHIRISSNGRMNVPLYFTQSVRDGVSIDWGDGSTVEKFYKTGKISASHTYSDIGDYIISLTPTDDCILGLGANNTIQCILGNVTNEELGYCNMLKYAYIGKNVKIENFAFAYCRSLSTVTIPSYITSIIQGAFYECSNLSAVIIPSRITSINLSTFYYCESLSIISIPNSIASIENFAFYNCNSLHTVTIPNGVTYIGEDSFRKCRSLSTITIPNGMTSISVNAFYECSALSALIIPNSISNIKDYAFAHCKSLGYCDFSVCTSVPTLSGTNAFYNIPNDCKLLIPADLLDEWKAATNWTIYASNMVAV